MFDTATPVGSPPRTTRQATDSVRKVLQIRLSANS